MSCKYNSDFYLLMAKSSHYRLILSLYAEQTLINGLTTFISEKSRTIKQIFPVTFHGFKDIKYHIVSVTRLLF